MDLGMNARDGDGAGAEPLFESVLSRLEGVRRRDASSAMARCPAHADVNASLSIGATTDKILLFCQAGCTTERVAAAVGLQMRDLFVANGEGRSAPAVQPVKLTACYDYCDAAGALIYQVLRYEPKKFRQRRTDGHGGWVYNLKDVAPLLYKLRELIAAPKNAWTLVPEGEKDVDGLAALGFIATTNSGGAGKFRPEFAEYFQDRLVALLPDNDESGLIHARKVAALLAPVAREVRIVEPPAAMPAKGDVSDLIGMGWGADLIGKLIERAPIYQAETVSPIICETEDQYPLIASASWKALEQRNRPPRLFMFQGVPIRLEADNCRVTLHVHRLRNEMAAAADWVSAKFQPTRPTVDLANLMLAARKIPFPVVKRFISAPVFDRDARLIMRRGFDPQSGIYLLCDVGVDVPERPDSDDVKRACALIDEYLFDFPFATKADKAGAIGLMIQPAVQELIDGPTPGHLVNASKEGSGKGLLVETIFDIHGVSVSPWAETRDDVEIKKALTTFFLAGKQVIYFENLTKPLTSAVLASAMTARRWSDRLLGVMREVDLLICVIWVLTANNPVLSAELLRRMSSVRLVPQTEHPELRSDFLHPDLRDWVKRNRAALLSAVLILVQNWISHGRPEPKKVRPLGSFETWTMVEGGILECAGVEEFLQNRREIADRSDGENAPWRELVAKWWREFGDREVFAKDLLNIAETVQDLPLGREREGSERNKVKSLGRQLRSHTDRVYGVYLGQDEKQEFQEFQIREGSKDKDVIRWKLADVKENGN
jgi:hypothetical protein